jgi:hypothetical protein
MTVANMFVELMQNKKNADLKYKKRFFRVANSGLHLSPTAKRTMIDLVRLSHLEGFRV